MTILNDVESYLSRYLVLGIDQLRIVSLWVLHTWQFSESSPSPNVTPYLYIHSAQKGSGKTLVIDLLETIVRNPVRATDMSVSTLFRLIEDIQPTVMLDEIDTIWSGAKHEDLRGAVNGGYRKGGHVWRTENLEPRKFSTFAPKLFAGIHNAQMPDTIMDRCIPITLKRANREELDTIQPFYHYEIEDEAAELSDKLHAWIIGLGTELRDYRPQVLRELSPRQWEISMPLVVIAKTCGCEPQVRKVLVRLLTAREERQTPEQELLTAIREAFGDRERMFTSEILPSLPKGYNGKLLGLKLSPFGIKGGTIRVGIQTGKGFYRHAFTDAWERYL